MRMAVDRSPAGVVALAPVADLEMAYRLNLSNGAAAEFVGGTPQSQPERFEAADPMRHSSDARRTLLHGTNDDVVPISLSESFVQARGADPGVVRVARIEGADHFDVIDPTLEAWEIVVSSVRGLLG